MTKAEFTIAIERTVDDLSNGACSPAQAKEAIVQIFQEALDPYLKSRLHLKLFLFRVINMRKLQKDYFNGKKSVFSQAKEKEQQVDNAIQKLTGDLGYTPEDLQQQYQQAKLL